MFGDGLDCLDGTCWPLPQHLQGWLDSHHAQPRRLVGARAGPHVDHCACLTERLSDGLSKARVWLTRDHIATPDCIVYRCHSISAPEIRADRAPPCIRPSAL